MQKSGASHNSPLDGAHSIPAAANASAGHAGSAPVQPSATSHGPAVARQLVPAGANDAGQVADVPVQRSGGSHGPVPAAHVVPTWNVSRHPALAPSQ